MTNVATNTQGAAAEVPAITITVDGVALECQPGELIINAAERAGVYIPRFCYHPHMDPVGMCRMCLVEVSGPRGFSLQPACYVRVQDGQEVLTHSAPARKAQEGVLEFLLVNHPLDCPVCDKGGECPLQDQAMSHGPGETRFIEEKRHWAKPIDIGPLVALDRERCIQCARCTRFAAEVAGDATIDFAFRGDHIEVAPFPTEPFDSYFSGNTVQICPVGALTSRPYRFKSRPWDLDQAETTCTTCAVGCRMAVQSSAGAVVRHLGIDSLPVNQTWLCDKGRFGYEALAHNRLTTPLVLRNGELVESSWHEALETVVAKIDEVLAARGPEAIAVIGGAHLTNEEAYAWAKLTKGVIGSDSIDAQLGDGLPAPVVLGLPRASIEETLSAKVVVLLAPDLREELPVLYLRLRGAAKQKGGPALIECSPVRSALSGLASVRLEYLPGEAAKIAEALFGSGDAGELGIDSELLARARALVAGVDPSEVVVVLGRPSVAESAASVAAFGTIAHGARPGIRFLSALRRANVHGALDMGMAPGVLPGRVELSAGAARFNDRWPALPTSTGRDTTEILRAAARAEIGLLVLLDADPLSDFPDRSLVEEAFEVPPFIVAVATHYDASNARADVVLPIAADHERKGTTTNLEGRVTRVADKVTAPGIAWPAWVVAHEIARRLGSDLGFANLESINEEITELAPGFGMVHDQMSSDGVLVPLAQTSVRIGTRPPAFDPMATPGISSVDEQGPVIRAGQSMPLGGAGLRGARANGATELISAASLPEHPVADRLDAYSLRLVVARKLYDNGTLVRSSPALAGLVDEPTLALHPSELARLGVGDGERLRVRAAHGELVVRVRGDEHVRRGVALISANVGSSEDANENVDPYQLIDASAHGTDVRVETI